MHKHPITISRLCFKLIHLAIINEIYWINQEVTNCILVIMVGCLLSLESTIFIGFISYKLGCINCIYMFFEIYCSILNMSTYIPRHKLIVKISIESLCKTNIIKANTTLRKMCILRKKLILISIEYSK